MPFFDIQISGFGLDLFIVLIESELKTRWVVENLMIVYAKKKRTQQLIKRNQQNSWQLKDDAIMNRVQRFAC